MKHRHIAILTVMASSLVLMAQTNVDVQFLTPNIVHVRKWPAQVGQTPPAKTSYSVILQPQKNAATRTATSDGNVCYSSSALHVTLNSATGQLTFATAGDSLLLAETQTHFEMRTGDADAGKYRVSQTWRLRQNELIYGLGQLRRDNMSWRGQEADIWNNNTYISIPYFSSQLGYGLYWDNAGRSKFKDNDEGTTFESEVAMLVDYYFMYRDGTQDGLIACIRELTGQATMFPLWAMGHWQCRERYKTSDELADALDRYRQLGIPVDVMVQDWQYWGCDSNWNAMRFENPYYINKVGDEAWAKYLPDDLTKLAEEYKAAGRQPRLKSPQDMVSYVHDNNARLMISIWASFGPWTQPFKELKEIGALLPFDTWPRNRGVMPYDAFNPAARDIYWKHLSHLYRMGFDAWWTDSTEPDHFEHLGDDDYITHDGTWRSVKNAFPLVHNRGIYQHQRAMSPKSNRVLQMTRSGAFGIQHYAAFSWSGDINASWNEMKKQIPSGLNYSICGIPFWNTDIGGFFYWDYNNDPHNPALQELHTRWMQWGTFMPLMRNHSSSPMVSELYNFGSPGDWAFDAQVQAIRLRYRLLPYIYSLAGATVQHSASILRPLVMDFPADSVACSLNSQYMFGSSLLVKPVTDPLYTWLDQNKRGHTIYPNVAQASAPVSVYLPTSTAWYDFFTNQYIQGGRTILRPTPIDQLPVYVRAGTILPIGPDVQYSGQQPWDDLELRIYTGADATFTLYEDDGQTYDYEHGAFTETIFTWDDAARSLTISDRKGKYKGMLKNRIFRIVLIDGNEAYKQNLPGNKPMPHSKTIQYNGQQQSIIL